MLGPLVVLCEARWLIRMAVHSWRVLLAFLCMLCAASRHVDAVRVHVVSCVRTRYPAMVLSYLPDKTVEGQVAKALIIWVPLCRVGTCFHGLGDFALRLHE